MMPGNSSSALRTIVSSSSLVAAAARESAPFETSSHSWPADLGFGRYHIRFALRFFAFGTGRRPQFDRSDWVPAWSWPRRLHRRALIRALGRSL
jgi:hypothetical protein